MSHIASVAHSARIHTLSSLGLFNEAARAEMALRLADLLAPFNARRLESEADRHGAYIASDAWGDLIFLTLEEFALVDREALRLERARRAEMLEAA